MRPLDSGPIAQLLDSSRCSNGRPSHQGPPPFIPKVVELLWNQELAPPESLIVTFGASGASTKKRRRRIVGAADILHNSDPYAALTDELGSFSDRVPMKYLNIGYELPASKEAIEAPEGLTEIVRRQKNPRANVFSARPSGFSQVEEVLNQAQEKHALDELLQRMTPFIFAGCRRVQLADASAVEVLSVAGVRAKEMEPSPVATKPGALAQPPSSTGTAKQSSRSGLRPMGDFSSASNRGFSAVSKPADCSITSAKRKRCESDSADDIGSADRGGSAAEPEPGALKAEVVLDPVEEATGDSTPSDVAKVYYAIDVEFYRHQVGGQLAAVGAELLTIASRPSAASGSKADDKAGGYEQREIEATAANQWLRASRRALVEHYRDQVDAIVSEDESLWAVAHADLPFISFVDSAVDKIDGQKAWEAVKEFRGVRAGIQDGIGVAEDGAFRDDYKDEHYDSNDESVDYGSGSDNSDDCDYTGWFHSDNGSSASEGDGFRFLGSCEVPERKHLRNRRNAASASVETTAASARYLDSLTRPGGGGEDYRDSCNPFVDMSLEELKKLLVLGSGGEAYLRRRFAGAANNSSNPTTTGASGSSSAAAGAKSTAAMAALSDDSEYEDSKARPERPSLSSDDSDYGWDDDAEDKESWDQLAYGSDGDCV